MGAMDSMVRWVGCLVLASAACQGPTATEVPPVEEESEFPSVEEDVAGALAERAPEIETLSLLGRPLQRPPIDPARRAELEADLKSAWQDLGAHPKDESAFVWLGRRQAYLGHYREAMRTFSEGLSVHPKSYRLLRHRGHRWITLRRFDQAVRDLSRAAELSRETPDEVEPDGAPNAKGIPRSTTHSSIYYHLGLALYLQGDYEQAALAYERCRGFCGNDDMLVATLYWQYLTLRRLGRDNRASELLALVKPEMDLLENFDYHRLLRLFQGAIPESELGPAREDSTRGDATLGYGIGMARLLTGDVSGAEAVFAQVLQGESWPAFGFIAAEVESARKRNP